MHGNGNRECKGCSSDVRVTRDQIQRLIATIESKGFLVVSEHTYNIRLDACRECLALEYETTCMHCGCLVEVRAKLAEKDCPYPGGQDGSLRAKWIQNIYHHE